MEKQCSKCREILPIDNFHKNKSTSDGYAAVCKPCFKIFSSSYKQNNKQAVSEYNKQYRATHLDTLREKGRAATKSGWHNPKLHPQMLLILVRSRAKKYDIPFNLTVDDIVIPSHCPILDIPLIPGKGKLHDGSPTVDKINPQLGYVKGNVRVISFKANRLKSDMDAQILRRILAYIEENEHKS